MGKEVIMSYIHIVLAERKKVSVLLAEKGGSSIKKTEDVMLMLNPGRWLVDPS